MMTQERNELHGILANSTNKDLNNSILHNQLLSERTQLKQKVSVLREENRKLWRDQISLQESCEKVKNLCDEAHEKIYELCAKEKQKQEKLEERLQYLLKQRDLVTKQIVLVKELQNHFAASQTRFENLQHDLATVQDESLLQTDLLQQEPCVCQANEPPMTPVPCNLGIHGLRFGELRRLKEAPHILHSSSNTCGEADPSLEL